jgi:predicted GTPase
VLQRFSAVADFARPRCSLEEREEYEPLVERGTVVYAGVDYGAILQAAEQAAEVLVWDGGNKDTPFYVPAVHLVLFATPIHLPRVLAIRTPTLRVRDGYCDHGESRLEEGLLRRLGALQRP